MNQIAQVTEADIRQARSEKGWTQHRVNVALGLFARGLSDAQIAVEIYHVTRNAVIGMRCRRGVHVGDSEVSQRPPPKCANSVRAGETAELREARRVSAAQRRTMIVRRPRASPAPEVDDLAIPIEQRRTLIELTGSCCRWPVGDPDQPDFFFCGALVSQPERDRPRPYCPSHMRRAAHG